MKNVGIILNPVSGKASKKSIETFVKELKKLEFGVNIYETKRQNHAKEIAKEIEKDEKIDYIVISGGDGTINEAINGLEKFLKPIGVIPSGSANVLSYELGIKSFHDTLTAIKSNKTISANLGLIESDGISRKFLLMVGIGFDGEVVKNINFKGSALLKKVIFIKEGIKQFFKRERKIFQIVADDKKINCFDAIVCKARRYGGNFLLAKDVAIDKDYFQLIAFIKDSRLIFLKVFLSVLLNQPIPFEVASLNVRNLEIFGKNPIQIDGEFFGYTPAKISIYEKSLKIFANLD